MPRGIFTQCLSVLLKEPVSRDAVEAALAGFTIHGRHEGAEHWATFGPAVTLAYRPEVNGLVMVDVVDHIWPDDMGNPQTDETVFAAGMMGHFGPLTSPGSLQRAMQQCWTWKEGRTLPGEHRAFARVRTSYAIGVAEDAPMLPRDWDAVGELQYMAKVVEALMALPGAVYFNPNGEVLRDQAGLHAELAHAQAEGALPLELWMNVRIYPYDADWVLMDTVGNGQLNDKVTVDSELSDVEALFQKNKYEFAKVDELLRGLTLYLHDAGKAIKDGDTIDGPGNVPWRASLAEKSAAMPPRPVVRVTPVDGAEPPAKPA